MINPFEEKSKKIDEYFMNWQKMYPKSYNKSKVSPFTKVRVILMNGTEYEATWFLHNFARHCDDVELKKVLAIVRRQEQQQQKRISNLKPINESILETAISYEQLAIELTAILAINEKDENNKKALDFALLEDFDHLYRFANLLKADKNIDSDKLVGKYTEIMPGRPTISEYRYPSDDIRLAMNAKTADSYSKLVAGIITTAEQQTMNYYMNVSSFYTNDLGRRLFAEIGMIEEQHVTQYESLKDPTCTWLEQWVMHEYTECYLYYSMMLDESDPYIKNVWAEHFEMEVAHLKLAAAMLKKYEKKNYTAVCPNPVFPKLLKFGENKKYIREILKSVNLTSKGKDYVNVSDLPKDDVFFMYQDITNTPLESVASHEVIESFIKTYGEDYRYQDSPHPIKELQSRKKDNTKTGRTR